MTVFFDTNVILDALTQRDLNYKPSQRLVRYAASGRIKGFISAKQVTDLYYSLRKYCSSEEQRKSIIKTVIDTFEVIPTIKSDIAYCLSSKINDLEDALLDEVCKVNCIGYLVTNNVKDYKEAKSVIFSPEDLLTLIEIE